MILDFIKSNILSRKLRSFLTIFSISISVILITVILNLFAQIEDGIIANAQNYDVLIGADGSSTQLAMNVLMFYDEPLGNIDSHYFENLKSDNRVNMVVPIAMGDNYRGFKIVGTTNEYIENLNTGIKQGNNFKEAGEVVLGAYVARQTGLKIGDVFVGTHGLGAETTAIHDETHEAFTYIVVGIMGVTTTSDDKAIFTDIESVWEVHGLHYSADTIESNDETDTDIGKNEASHAESEAEAEHQHDEGSITAILVRSKSFTDAYLITEEFNNTDGVQAINPAVTLRRLLGTIDTGEKIASLMALVSVILAIITLFVVMLAASNERLKDMAILRSLGAMRITIFKVMLLETLILAVIGCFVGFAVAHITLSAVSNLVFNTFGIFINALKISTVELLMLLTTLFLSLLAGMFPAFRVYSSDASKHLK